METTPKETLVRKILNHEIGQLLTIVVAVYAFVSLVILPIKSIEKDIESITGNHLMHIQDSMEQMKDDLKTNNEEHKLLMMQLERTATILEQHMIQDK